ncbi:MAG: hypothetical protein HY014_10460 [Acidobacteria bacterium]|nr:hypothetical protein [Acidobacteriota bacterium]MBI3488576.1 hypothetical protein [Acidobacteriota bacterium]
MTDSTWNIDLPDKPRRRGWPVWVHVSMVILFAGAVIGPALMRHTSGVRIKAWPLALAVHRRMATDEGARDLFRHNPLCANGYESEEAFLEQVHRWRPRIGSLPPGEPPESGETYGVEADSFAMSVACKGAAGGWLRMRFVTGPAAGGKDVGEGLAQLIFGHSIKDMHESAKIAGLHARKHLWTEFRDLLLKLGTDDTALALYRAGPALQSRWTTEQASLRETRAWRPRACPSPG